MRIYSIFCGFAKEDHKGNSTLEDSQNSVLAHLCQMIRSLGDRGPVHGKDTSKLCKRRYSLQILFFRSSIGGYAMGGVTDIVSLKMIDSYCYLLSW